MNKSAPIPESLEATLAEIGKRNLLRAKETREKMGEKWVCHSSHAPVKKKY